MKFRNKYIQYENWNQILIKEFTVVYKVSQKFFLEIFSNQNLIPNK